MDDDDDDDWLGPKVGSKKLCTEFPREITVEQRVAALKVVVKKETPEEKEKRKRDKEERKLAAMSEEDRQKKARIEQELADSTAFLLAFEAEERRQLEANVMRQDNSEKPATSNTWKAEEDANVQAADEARADRADEVLDLGTYYKDRLFPMSALVQYATRNGTLPLRHTEFAVITQKDGFWRHRHFEKGDALADWLAEVGPKRVEIGPWHMEISKVSTTGMQPYEKLPLERYLAFDFDMCDFEPGNAEAEKNGYIRKCRCRLKKNGVCSYGCWFYVRVGLQVVTYLMRNVFGAKEVLAIYSGNRGVHLMCVDKVFVRLSADERKGVLARLKLFADPLSMSRHPEHSPYIYEYIMKKPFYDHWLDGQVLILETPQTLRMLLICARLEHHSQFPVDVIPLLVQLSNATSRQGRIDAWLELCQVLGKGIDFERVFIFRVMFPRLDEAVTTNMDHCLKAPFVIHPATRRCSVPIPDIDVWLPHMAPRASELIPLPPDERVPLWAQEKEARRCAMTLAQYVQHVSAVMNRAYPLPIGHLDLSTAAVKKEIPQHNGYYDPADDYDDDQFL
jgi:DNA primase small subunit